MEEITYLPLIAEMLDDSGGDELHCLSIQTVSIFLKQLNLNVLITTGVGHSLSSYTTLLFKGIYDLLSRDYVSLDHSLVLYTSEKQRIPKTAYDYDMNDLLNKNSFIEVNGSQMEL